MIQLSSDILHGIYQTLDLIIANIWKYLYNITDIYKKMVLLDIKDKKLLYYLSINSRFSHTYLSRKIQLSKNAVTYRIERLQKKGIITKFASVVNLGSLNVTTITVLLKFNEDIYEKKEIIEFFKNHALADWVISLSGQWDLFVELVAKDFMSLYTMVDEIVARFSDSLNTYQLFFSRDTLRVEHLIEDFYKPLRLEQPIQKERTKEIYEIGEVDKKILKILNENSSLPYLQIAQKINSTIDVVRYRIKNLVAKGIIIKFFAEISLPKLGYTEYLYTLKLKNLSQEKMEKMRKRIQDNSHITYAFVDATGFNILFVCAFNNAEGIDHLSRSLRKEFSDILEKQEYQIIKEQILFNLFPKGI